MSGYEIASLTEIESVKAVGTLRWTPVRKHFGITAFGISAYTATEVGQDVVEEHTEEQLGHEELYVVVAGRATFVLDGEEKDVPAGSVVFLRDPKVKRYARAEEPGTTVLAIGGKPGSHEVSAWEYFFTAYGVVDEDPDRAIAEIQAGLAEKPDHAGLLLPSGVHLLSRRPARRGRRGARPGARARSEASEVGGRGRGPRAATRRPEDVARRTLPERWNRIRVRTGDDEHCAVALAGERADEQVESERERERLVRLLAPERHQLLRCRCAAQDVAVGDGAHRDVGDERLAVRARDRDRERVRAGERLAPVGMGEPRR